MTTNNKNNPSKDSLSNIEIYQSEDGQADIRVQFDDDSVWLNRHQLAELFDRDVKTVGKHINNVFKEGELDRDSVVAKFATVQVKGSRQVERQVEHHNLDVIISVGYRVKLKKGTQFSSIQLQNTIFTLFEETLHSFEISVLDFKKCDTNSRVRYNCIST